MVIQMKCYCVSVVRIFYCGYIVSPFLQPAKDPPISSASWHDNIYHYKIHEWTHHSPGVGLVKALTCYWCCVFWYYQDLYRCYCDFQAMVSCLSSRHSHNRLLLLSGSVLDTKTETVHMISYRGGCQLPGTFFRLTTFGLPTKFRNSYFYFWGLNQQSACLQVSK